MTTQQTEIQNSFIRGITWKLLGGILMATISITTSVVMGFNSLQNEVKSIRIEFRASLDSVKMKQLVRGYETEMHFQKIDNKLEHIEQNTNSSKK